MDPRTLAIRPSSSPQTVWNHLLIGVPPFTALPGTLMAKGSPPYSPLLDGVAQSAKAPEQSTLLILAGTSCRAGDGEAAEPVQPGWASRSLSVARMPAGSL